MKLRFTTEKTPSNSTYYSLIDDWGLIEASFAQQYSIRLRREEDMLWDEFTTLLAGIHSETPLGRIVAIRSENDPEKLKNFSPEEKRIRNEWINKHKRVVTNKQEYDAAMIGFHAMFKAMAEKGG